MRCVLAAIDWLGYAKMERTLPRSAKRKLQRQEWAMEQLATATDWTSVVSSDGKRFLLDGPNGLAHYWRGVCLAARQTGRRQSGGGGVMVWGGFSIKGTTEFEILNGKQDASSYVYTLSEFSAFRTQAAWTGVLVPAR